MRYLPFPLLLTFWILNSFLARAEPARWAIVIHGGAGANVERMSSEEVLAHQRALEQALTLGVQHLEAGGSALDCVEKVVRSLEDAPEFNAGRGAVFNSQGRHELDASIMEGRTLSCGAVAGVTTVKNPISLARLVSQKTKHVMLAGEGAEAFATSMGVERVPNSYFSTEARQSRRPHSKGTVGCVALDTAGDLAAATSTGGLTGKKWGRVGDSPIIGAGCYADNRSCAVSGTGIGEEYIRRSLAHDISARMLYGGRTLKEAGAEALASLPENCGGIIAVDANGQVLMIFNTPGMARGAATSAGDFMVGLGPEDGD